MNDTIVFHHIKIKINTQEYNIENEYYDSNKCVRITLLSLMGCYKNTCNINFSPTLLPNDKNEIETMFSEDVSLKERHLTLLTFLKNCLEILKSGNNDNNTITNIYNNKEH